MKKLAFLLVLCFVTAAAFAQKRAVNAAKAELRTTSNNTSTVDIAGARSNIQAALQHPETVNDAETWYVAGMVENKQFDTERAKELIGVTVNYDLMYSALDKIFPYFMKADSLEQIPDEKGKVRLKHRKSIRDIMTANRHYYINAGLHFYEKGDMQKAYQNFRLYGDIPNLAIYEGEKNLPFIPLAEDTTGIQIRYFAALSAAEIPNSAAVIELANEIKDLGFNENDMYKLLSSEYAQLKDTANLIQVLEQGAAKFPDDQYYIFELMYINIAQGEIAKSINYIKQALAANPNHAGLWSILGRVYEEKQEIDKAVESYKKAIEVNPTGAEYYSHLGRLYFNLGVDAGGVGDNIEKARAYFRESLPYYEKAFQLNPEDADTIFALRNIYYSLGMNAEYEKMDQIYNSSRQ
jgi:tetratricopeptide (TPR) repeat protein